MKIKAKNSSVKSMKLIVPIDGIIDIDANGVTEVTDKAADLLVNKTNDWNYLDVEDKKLDKEPIDEDAEVVAGIKKMKIEDMIAMAKEAEYPEAEWNKFSQKPKLMAAYLIKKYNEEKQYAMIILTQGDAEGDGVVSLSAPVITADPTLDITNDVLAGLNEEYIASKNENQSK